MAVDGNGTEFRPGSHVYTRDLTRLLLLAKIRKKLRPLQAPALAPGDALLFDYRVLHRGQANARGARRPVFNVTIAAPSFRDLVNFPKRSMFDAEAAAAARAEAAAARAAEAEAAAAAAGGEGEQASGIELAQRLAAVKVAAAAADDDQ